MRQITQVLDLRCPIHEHAAIAIITLYMQWIINVHRSFIKLAALFKYPLSQIAHLYCQLSSNGMVAMKYLANSLQSNEAHFIIGMTWPTGKGIVALNVYWLQWTLNSVYHTFGENGSHIRKRLWCKQKQAHAKE